MTHPTSARDLETRAHRRVAARMGFYVHAFVYVAVNLGLFAIDAMDGSTRWHLFPLAGWGLGLAIHGLVTLLSLSGWRERLVEREIEALRRR